MAASSVVGLRSGHRLPAGASCTNAVRIAETTIRRCHRRHDASSVSRVRGRYQQNKTAIYYIAVLKRLDLFDKRWEPAPGSDPVLSLEPLHDERSTKNSRPACTLEGGRVLCPSCAEGAHDAWRKRLTRTTR